VEGAVKILLVEDSQRLLRSLSQGLKKLGYAVDAAADGEEALALAETYDYHVIVLDPDAARLAGSRGASPTAGPREQRAHPDPVGPRRGGRSGEGPPAGRGRKAAPGEK
jgi:ActR/RegA family two-component response regulator